MKRGKKDWKNIFILRNREKSLYYFLPFVQKLPDWFWVQWNLEWVSVHLLFQAQTQTSASDYYPTVKAGVLQDWAKGHKKPPTLSYNPQHLPLVMIVLESTKVPHGLQGAFFPCVLLPCFLCREVLLSTQKMVTCNFEVSQMVLKHVCQGRM